MNLAKMTDQEKVWFYEVALEDAADTLRRKGFEDEAARYEGYVREMRGSNGIQTVEVAKARPNTAAPQGVAYAELPDCDLRTLAGNTAFSYAQKTYAAPRYLPRTPGEASGFEPHGWVIDAMRNAIKLAALRASNWQVGAADTRHADAHLRALLHYTEGFYGAAIQHGMKAGETANAVAHVESAARALHRLAIQPAPTAQAAPAAAKEPTP